MQTQWLACLTLTLFGLVLAKPAPLSHDDDRWDTPRLKQCLVELGYEPKTLSDKKFEVALTKGDHNIPVGTEVSGSGNYVWLTARLAETPSDEKAGKLLRRNFKIQPAQFYVTDKGHLMIGMTCDNRGLTNAILRKALDKLTSDVAATADEWGK